MLLDGVRQVREAGDAWAGRAERLQSWLSNPPALDRSFIENILVRPDPGLVEDLELYLRHEARAGRPGMDADAAGLLRQRLATWDETTLPGPDRAALIRLRRELDSGFPLSK
jgi:hypothetical protein